MVAQEKPQIWRYERSREEGVRPCVCHDGVLGSNWKPAGPQTPCSVRAALGNHGVLSRCTIRRATVCVPTALCMMTLARAAKAAEGAGQADGPPHLSSGSGEEPRSGGLNAALQSSG